MHYKNLMYWPIVSQVSGEYKSSISQMWILDCECQSLFDRHLTNIHVVVQFFFWFKDSVD